MHGYGGWNMGAMGFWWILVLVFLAALVWASIAYFRSGNYNARETPEQILKRRFAKGEIDQEQYDRMLSDLRK